MQTRNQKRARWQEFRLVGSGVGSAERDSGKVFRSWQDLNFKQHASGVGM